METVLSVQFPCLQHPNELHDLLRKSYIRAFNLVHISKVSLTPYSTVLLEKQTGLQLVKKFPACCETRRFNAAFTSARHQTQNPVVNSSERNIRLSVYYQVQCGQFCRRTEVNKQKVGTVVITADIHIGHPRKWGRDSRVGIATRYGLDGPVIESR
jgi:hypothetical protein